MLSKCPSCNNAIPICIPKIKQKKSNVIAQKILFIFGAPILFSPTAVEAPKLLIVKKDLILWVVGGRSF